MRHTKTLYRARFHETRVSASGSGPLRVECTIENAGTALWTEHAAHPDSNGVATIGPVSLGYHDFDARTRIQVVEGEHTGLGNDCAPGERRRVIATVQLPPEEGDYQVWISPVQENVAWFHDRGSEFVEVHVSATQNGIGVRSVRKTCRSGVLARRSLRFLRSVLWSPLQIIARHWSLMLSMVKRDVLGRYRGSAAGALWTLLHPLLLMAAYYFVFAIVLRVRFTPGTGSGGFVFYFLCGMLPWMAVSEALGRSANVVLEHSNFIKRVVFPLEVLPINVTATGLVTELFGLAIFLAAVLTLGPGLRPSAAYFPVVLIPQLLLTAGLCWFLAALGMFLRDTGQMMGYLLTIWFFVTPICYPASSLPARFGWLFRKNPMYVIVTAYRAIFLEGSAPQWAPLIKLWLLGVGAFWLGYLFFFKAKRSFPDLI